MVSSVSHQFIVDFYWPVLRLRHSSDTAGNHRPVNGYAIYFGILGGRITPAPNFKAKHEEFNKEKKKKEKRQWHNTLRKHFCSASVTIICK